MSTLAVNSRMRVARRRRATLLRPLLATLGKALVVALLVVLITFVLGKLVLGNPGRLILGNTASPAAVESFNHGLGLDQPFIVQFGHYLGNLVQGKLGDSYAYQGKSVWDLVGPALLVSAEIAILTVAVAVLLAIPLGILAARHSGRFLDHLVRGGSVIGLSSPTPFVGLVLIRLVAVGTGVLPAGGWGGGSLGDPRYLVLPVVALTVYLCPILVRSVRERAIVVLEEPYVEAAIARGLPRWRVTLAHVVPNSIGPLLVVLGFNFGGLLSGSVIVDVVFGLPGLGHVLVTAVGDGDLPVIQGVALLTGLMVTLANVLAETTQRILDPRLRG
jgi:peptide/nickel transport system permease protein